MKRIIGIVVVLSVVLSVALFFRLRQLRERSEGPAGGTGTVEGIEVHVTARMPARITAISVDEGAEVEADQALVELDCTDAEATLAQAQAQLAAAQAAEDASRVGVNASAATARAARKAVEATEAQAQTVEVGKASAAREAARLNALKTAGAVSGYSLDRVRDQVTTLDHQLSGLKASQEAARAQATAARLSTEAAQSQIRSAESAVAVAQANVTRAGVLVRECKLLAPRSGIVLSRNFEPGEAVLPGTHVLTLVDLSEARVTFYLPNAELAAAAPGKAVTVRADAYPDELFTGTILRVSAEAEFTPRNVQTREDRDRLVYGVTVAIPNPGAKLRAGMPVEVSIDGTARR